MGSAYVLCTESVGGAPADVVETTAQQGNAEVSQSCPLAGNPAVTNTVLLLKIKAL